jgi:UV DNA damage repair endonuclease
MKLGLVCISEILKKKDKSLAFKTMTRKRFSELDRQLALKELSSRILHNCKLTKQIVEQNKLTFLRSEVIANNDTTLVEKVFTKELSTFECTSVLKDELVSTSCKQIFKFGQV